MKRSRRGSHHELRVQRRSGPVARQRGAISARSDRPRSPHGARAIDPDTTYDRTLWNEIVALGWTGLIVPEEYGGLGLSLVDWVVITEELGRSLAPCPYLGNYAGTLALLRAGSAATERDAVAADRLGRRRRPRWRGARANNPKTRARLRRPCRNGRLSGTKRYVIDADTATHLVVSARDAAGSLGLYVVERERRRIDRAGCRGWTSRGASAR